MNKKSIWQDGREHPILTLFIIVSAFFVVKFFHDNWHMDQVSMPGTGCAYAAYVDCN